MKRELINILILAGLFLALFAVAEAGYYFLKIKPEWTRKFVHFGTGLLALLFPLMLHSHWSVLALCFSFFILLQLSLKFNFLRSINGVQRKSVGSLAYPAAVYGCYLAFCFFGRQYFYFYLPVLILAVSDPLAAIFGKWQANKLNTTKERKTFAGSLAFFLSAFILCLVLSAIFQNNKEINTIIYSVFIAFFATITEMVSSKGWDNITIPASVLAGLTIVEYVHLIN